MSVFPPAPEPAPGRRAGLVALLALAVSLAGCQKDEIARYTAARLEPPKGARDEALAKPAYKLPPGWEEADRLVTMSVATVKVRGGGREATLTVTPLAGGAGGLLPNVNRWRVQIGLPRIGEEEMQKSLRKGEVDGSPAQLIDLAGPEQRTLGAVVTRDPQTWFFKLSGPAELVGKEKPAFEAFLASVKFPGGTGANP
jgi:hypothetical protein